MKQTTKQLFIITILTAYFHAFIEWLFFATTPSTLSTLTFFESLTVFFITGGVISLFLCIPFLILTIPARKFHTLTLLPAVLMLSVTALIMLDNFTYTLFKIGIVSTFGAWRIIYIIISILILYWIFRFISRIQLWAHASTLTFILLGISAFSILTVYLSRDPALTPSITALQPSTNRPNIIVLGSDGLSASYLSAYGFKEDTTPFIKELMKDSLVAENAFPNASSTTGSTTSFLTGKEPAVVKVYRYPDILTAEDSFEHLPGILKGQGYYTVEIGTPTYVDALRINLVDGFDIINGRFIHQPMLDALRFVLGNSPSTYFIQLISQRASERLLHIFFIREMDNPIQQVHSPSARYTDTERVEEIFKLVDNATTPVFIFSHFMNTHGPHFTADGATPSGESPTDKEWDLNLYKEALRAFDKHVETIYNHLVETGQLDNTILIIYTDHGYRYVVNQRTPLIMHFPNSEHVGSRQNNIQVIDIPVTILDYLNITPPNWMTGTSILNDETPAMREIFSITGGSPKKIIPPFYQVKSVQIIVCQKWFSLNVQDNITKTGNITNHTAPCDIASLPSDDVLHQKILAYLEQHGYDTSTIK